MPLTVKLSSSSVLDCSAEVVAVGVTEAALEKQKALVALDAALHEQLFVHVARAKFTGASGQVLDIPTWGHLPAARLVLVGMGKIKGSIDAAALRALAAAASRQALSAASLALALLSRHRGRFGGLFRFGSPLAAPLKSRHGSPHRSGAGLAAVACCSLLSESSPRG